MRNAGNDEMAPPRSLGRYALDVRLRRALRTLSQGIIRGHEDQEGRKKKDARSRFSIGSASPDEHHRNGRYKSVEGETRQDLKMQEISLRRLPRALSCSDPAAYRIPVPPFSLSGSVALSHSSRCWYLGSV